jgi:hypothetical protein
MVGLLLIWNGFGSVRGDTDICVGLVEVRGSF